MVSVFKMCMASGILVLVNILDACSGMVYNASLEKELYKHLFTNYNSYIVPRNNLSTPVPVAISVYFEYLDAVDVKSQTFTVRMFFNLEWTDSFLTWQTDLYTGVKDVRVHYETIWTPNLHISGSVGKRTDYGQEGAIAHINSDGLVLLWPSKVHKISCIVNIEKYPFDQQNCVIDISSWTYNDNQVAISAGFKQIDLSMYKPNGEWQIEVRNAYLRTDHGYTHLVYPFTIRRKWQFITLNVFFPTVCSSLLTLLCFVLPAESGERVGLSISIFLTLAVFMTVANSDLPRTADGVSLLGAYIALQLAWSGLTIVLTVLSSVFFCNKSKAIPEWILRIQMLKRRRDKVTPSEKSENEIEQSPSSPGNDLSLVQKTNGSEDQNLSWEYIATIFNRLCFCISLLWQCVLHLWFSIRIYS